MGFLPFIALTAFSLAAFAALDLRAQNRIADLFRLDVCARRITASREKLYRRLVDMNQAIHELQLIVYAARGLKVIPGVGAFAEVGEEAALVLLQNLARGQDILVEAERWKELKFLACAKSSVSRGSAACVFSKIPPLEREETFFPDVPGRIEHPTDNEELASARCFLLSSQTVSAVQILGSPKLREKEFRQVYAE